ncbi:glycosyltransferase [Nocardioides rotundus]|uniref:glycosyltransferase n=1 Tax=Nocardioides rotundus TaxID=1774216 RepID=UPI001CBA959F|nr:glycosyltransferase [Nocardioides rotundus]UAL30494.1 glycosyltransferase [Nocardioides rotundus]
MAESVTVLVPALDESASIDACLLSVRAQTHRDLHIVVVDNGSTDDTRDRVRAHASADPRVELVEHPQRSIPGALNAGLQAARGTWLVRVDAHSTVPPDYVARAVERLGTGRWAGVGGRKDAVARTGAGKAIAAVLGSRLAVGGSVYHHGDTVQEVDHIPFGAYPTSLVRQLGGWREDIANNEDFEFDQRLRAHGPLLFDPELRISWHGKETVGDLFAQYRRYGTGKPAVALAHPASVSPRHLLPPALVAWLAGAATAVPRRPGLAAAMAAPYLLVVGACSASIVRDLPDDAEPTTVPAALVAMQVGWGVGFWEGAARLVRGGWRRPRRA